MKGKKLQICQSHLKYELQTQGTYRKIYYLKTLVSLMDLRIYLCTFLYSSHVVKNFLSAFGLFFPATFFVISSPLYNSQPSPLSTTKATKNQHFKRKPTSSTTSQLPTLVGCERRHFSGATEGPRRVTL